MLDVTVPGPRIFRGLGMGQLRYLLSQDLALKVI